MNLLKITIVTILGLIGFTLFLNFLSADEPNTVIKEEIFRKSVLYSSGYEGNPGPYSPAGFTKGFCFGIDGGQGESLPCVLLWGDLIRSENDLGQTCYNVQYIPEVNYGFTPEYLETDQRRLLWPSDNWSVEICGKYIKTTTWFNSGKNPENWIFLTDQFVNQEIYKQLKERGYDL